MKNLSKPSIKYLFQPLFSKSNRYYRGRKYLFMKGVVEIITGILQILVSPFRYYCDLDMNLNEYIILKDFERLHKKK